MVATMAQNVLDANKDFIGMSKELEVLQTAKEEKAYGWEALKLIADQYGYEWDSLRFSGKPEPTSQSALNRLLKEYSVTETTETTPEGVTEALRVENGPVEYITEGVTVSPGEEDKHWYEYRREDGSTFRVFDKLT